MATLKTKILHRNDTTANWTSNNPVLAKGEFGIEWTTAGASGVEGACKVKVGDGFTAWNDLNYFGGDAVKIVTSGSGNTVVSMSSATDANGVITYTLTLGNRLTGSGLTANTILLGNGSYAVKTSSKTITTTLGSDDTTVPTSKAVATAISTQVASAVQYLGTIPAVANLSTSAGKGDFYRASADVAGVWHAGDIIIAEKDSPSPNVDGTNWSVIHGENVGVTDVDAGVGITVDKTNTAVPKVNVNLKDPTVQTVAAAGVTATASRTYAIQVNSDNQLVVNVPWNTGTDTRDYGYGKITPANSTAETALTGNATQITASGYTENVKFSAANKWIVLAGTNSSTAGSDELKWGHILSGVTAGTTGPSADVTQSARSSASMVVPTITYDAAGHITGITTKTLNVVDTDTDRSSLAYCTTAAATAAKVATMPGFALATGQYIFLRTTVTNSATSSVTLNINSTGAKPVKIGNASTAPTASNFPAGDYLANYDGTNWILTRIYWTDNNTNASHSGIGICSTAAATAAKAVTFPNFALVTNQNIIIRVNNKNTATSGVTLNVNSTGAKSIKIGGSAWSTSNELNAGDYLATYDGTYWNLTRICLSDIVTSSASGLAPKMTANNAFLARVGSEANPTWNTLTILDGGSASTEDWGTITTS